LPPRRMESTRRAGIDVGDELRWSRDACRHCSVTGLCHWSVSLVCVTGRCHFVRRGTRALMAHRTS
jgi:hypothetical protein